MSAASPLGMHPGAPHHVVYLFLGGHGWAGRAIAHLGSRRGVIALVALALAGSLLLVVVVLIPAVLASISAQTHGPTPSPQPVARLG
ncbi:MAG: hypothetical protein M3171_04305 [Actinomycetota bacterium]|nr:hypothetical protein [Actinomycetota bacterium]